jgi:hypothetical protein
MCLAVPISLYSFSSTFIFSNIDIIFLHFLYLDSSADLWYFPDRIKKKDNSYYMLGYKHKDKDDDDNDDDDS